MKFTEFRDTTQSTNQQGFAKAQNRLEKGVAEGSSENKYSNLSNRGVSRGINRAGDDFNRMMDLDQAESPHYKTQHQQDTKQRLKTKPMAGPKGVLPEQGVAEGDEAQSSQPVIPQDQIAKAWTQNKSKAQMFIKNVPVAIMPTSKLPPNSVDIVKQEAGKRDQTSYSPEKFAKGLAAMQAPKQGKGEVYIFDQSSMANYGPYSSQITPALSEYLQQLGIDSAIAKLYIKKVPTPFIPASVFGIEGKRIQTSWGDQAVDSGAFITQEANGHTYCCNPDSEGLPIGYIPAQQGVAEAKADPLGAWIAHKNGTEARKFKTREGAKKYVASHAGFTVSSSEAFHDTYRKKKVQEVKKFRTNYGWAGGSKEPRSAHAKQVATKHKEYDKGLGKFEPTDDMVGTAKIVRDIAMSNASPEHKKAAIDALNKKGVAEGSVTPDINVNKVHDDGHEKEWHIYRGKEMIGYVIKNQPDTAEGLYIAHGHGPGRAFDKEFTGLTPAVKYIASLKEGVAEGDYPDGSSIKTPGNEDWKQQYQQAVMAVKNARTQQEYEAASDRAGRIKDLLASKGIQVGAVLGQQGVAEGLYLDEGITDFILKAKDKFLRLKDALSGEWAQSKQMWQIVKKGNKATSREINFANNQFKDILKMVGLAAWYTVPLPGNTLLILGTEKLLNRFEMSIMPDKIKNQVLNVKEQGVAEGMKQTLRRFDPTIKARIRSKSQDQTNQGLDTIQHLADLDLTSDDMVSRAMKPNTYFKNAERYAKLANKGVTEDHGPEHPEAPVNYGEYDREGDMAKDDLRTIDDAAEELYSILQADENLPEWVQSKITKAVDYIDTARDYMKAQKYEPGVAEGMFTKGPAIDPIIGKQINNIINRLWIRASKTKDEYLKVTVQELFDILRNTGGTYSAPGSPGIRDVAEGGAKYKVKSIGHDAKGDYYISPSTGKKVYKKAKVGDHENPKTGEHKGVTEATESRIDDGWFKQGAFKTSKKAAPVKYQLAQQSGTVNTLEGPVRYEAGHYIMTGPKGEQYPISPEKFNTLYDDNGDGTSTPKKISKLAKLADHDGVLHTSWGDLQYTKGNDYIVRHGAGDYGAVKKDIFAQTYDNQARKLGIDEEKFNITFKAKTPAGKSFEKKYDIDAADKYAAFDKIKKRLGAQYDALNYPTFLQGKKKAKMPPSVKTAMKNLNKGKVS